MLKAIPAMVFFIILKVKSHHESMHGRITYPFMLPCHDSLASSFHTARIEQVAVCTHGEE